ncbi:MAG: hypothetical protein RMK19_07530 [Bacteroidia bacterium]|nr:hypothetical protein [Bacteroidia bacterium]MDW8015845.1 hypothetical protein [Bacteroidia bacterium]
MGWIAIVLLSTDSLSGVQYVWKGLFPKGLQLCGQLQLLAANRPLVVMWQESTAVGWRVLHRIPIDRWSLPRDYLICCPEGKAGQKVRLTLGGLSPQHSRVVLYEGYPWGVPPAPPEMSVDVGRSAVVRITFHGAGNYILRAYNRFGEEIFTLPLEATGPSQIEHSLPTTWRGNLLLQLYSVGQAQPVAERAFQL